MNINFKIAMYFTAIIICCTSFGYYIWITYNNTALLMAIVIFCSIMAALSIILICAVRKHIEYILSKLSKLIYSIIDMNDQEVFSVLNDDMLGKLQSQVIKLTNILKAQNSRIKKERDEIKLLISDISHQLKTPLSNLKLYYELLQDSSISKDEYTEFSKNMQSQIEKLSFLMESMIKMSRLEGGVIKLTPRQTSLNDVCLTAIKQAYQKSKAKNIEIKFNAAQDVVLNIDKNWTVEAIFNIIDNAVKYTNFGRSIIIEVIQYDMFVRIDIIDNGIGISEKEINNIFKRFYRGEGSKDEEGIGLGLYLTRQIVSKQNGYIKVKSKVEQGSTFSVFLSLN
ncbi:signal transduction histidine kinase [Clostridium pascui]|uniref:ATP-binding protein n=1 Tax=Clostridium pascui TaxID=46609 RepID=UPI00195C8C6F|nr:signal transduction histidine kinase [Clostridium pascui]